MQILAVDVGTGTQDVLLFDTEKEPENALKLVMPSPTVMLARAIDETTAAGHDLLLTGVQAGPGFFAEGHDVGGQAIGKQRDIFLDLIKFGAHDVGKGIVLAVDHIA